MNIKVSATNPKKPFDWIIPVLNGEQRKSNLKAIADHFEFPFDVLERDFKGEKQECFIFYGKNHEKIFLVGVGNSQSFGEIFKPFKSFSVKHKKLFSQ